MLEGGGPALRCRTIRRRPESCRWAAERVAEIVATPRRPSPLDPEKETVDGKKKSKVKIERPEDNPGEPEVQEEADIHHRGFRVTNRILEKYDDTAGCPGCEAKLNGRGRLPGQDREGHESGCCR